MSRRWFPLLAVVAAGLAAWAVWQSTRAPAAADVAEVAPATASIASPGVDAPTPATPVSPVAVADAPTVARWIDDATAGDPVRRAAALKSLATAPRELALPVLRRALTDGEPGVDRPLALESLREIALQQGDADGRIRDAVRGAMSHGDDHAPMEALQETLDAIEMSQSPQGAVTGSQR